MKSEFGKGLAYCLGLFLAHEREYWHQKEVYELAKCTLGTVSEMWFNGAADHLYELDIGNAPKHLQKRLAKFCNKCIGWRLTFGKGECATEKDVLWAIDEAKELLRLIDNAHGIKTVKATWK